MEMTEAILKTQAITKKYGNFCAVDTMNIELKRGDIYGLVGRNGAGKTTLLKMVSGLTVPTSGNLELNARSSQKELEKMRGRMGCIIETPGFLPYLSAEKNLEYYRIQRGIGNKNCVKESLRFVGLDNTGKKKFKNFSLGMKQRLGLALAIMGDPELLILDEPVNGLDPMGMAEFREMIVKLNREKNTTILISSHILGELSQIATLYGFINNGRLVEQISAVELAKKCKRSLRIKVSDTNKAAAIIRKEFSCNNFEVISDSEIQLAELLDIPELVVQALVKNEVMVFNVNQVGINLEEYFIELVGGNHHA
jgi:ABC-2 type transport system ATP-binding protein